MAGTLFEDNLSPYLTLVEQGSAPSSPAAGRRKLYVLSSDHLPYLKDSAGAVVGLVANPMSASADLIVGGSSGVPTRLAKGNAGGRLAMLNGAIAWDSDSTFPVSPASGDRRWRSDQLVDFAYDGTRWLCTCPHHLPMPASDAVNPISATGTEWRVALPIAGTQIRVIDLWVSFFVNGGTALGASHKWVLQLKEAVSGTVRGTVNIDSGSSSVWRSSGLVSVATNIATTEFELEILATKTGTPGNLFATPMISYRIVQT